jgi:hypothetical protein
MPEQLRPGTVMQFADGYTASSDGQRWDLFLDAVPAAPWEVLVLGTTSCVLATAVDADDTSWTVDHTEPNRWDTGVTPLGLVINDGEPFTAESISDVAAAYVAVGAASHANNAAVTPALYSGATTGDLMLCWSAMGKTSATLAINNGWQRMVGLANAVLWGKVHDGSETAPTVTPSGGASGDMVSAYTFGWRNMVTDIDNVLIDFADWTSTANAQSIRYPPLPTPGWPGCVLLYLGWKLDFWTSITMPGGVTTILSATTSTGNENGITAGYIIQTVPSANTSGTITVSGGSSQPHKGMIVALAPGRQTMTVTRRSDAVSHAAGETIQLDDASRLAL